jgi:Glycoside hydrolase family 44
MLKSRRIAAMLIAFGLGTSATFAQSTQIIYDDALQPGWSDWGWAPRNYNNTTPVHGGSKSISVTAGAYEALYIHVDPIDISLVTNLTFWINGGSGGQIVQVQGLLNGAAQPGVALAPLPTNAWVKINLTMAALNVSGAQNFSGFWIQSTSGNPIPTFYVDDIALQSGPPPAAGTNAPVNVLVDAALDRHAISPLIYGLAFVDTAAHLLDLNTPLHRSGGNATTRYNWQLNASSRASDWYFESLPSASSVAGADGDDFIQQSKNGNAQPMLTIPIIGWVAKLGAGRSGLASFSTNKYGVQTGNDWQWFPTAGNGLSQTNGGQAITNNNPLDANMIVDTNFQAGWVQHLTNRWGTATNGGLRYYIMDNEWALWNSTHRDVHPNGATMDETLNKFCDYATMVKSIDPNALVVGSEEWGWTAYLYSAYDAAYATAHTNWSFLPDRNAHGGQDYQPWLLNQIRLRSEAAGIRLLDVFTLHYYPQELNVALSDDVSTATQLRRNRSTRALWDTNYVNESWINSVVKLIPRMKQWVASNYPATPTGITEYNWGAEGYMNGATAQADVLGIFGREGLDLATRWTTPASGSPCYNAIKMYRNYDGNKSTFGDTSVRASVPNPDNLSAFAAVRSSDGRLTLMVINKDILNSTPLSLTLSNVPSSGTAQVWQLASTGGIVQLANTGYTNRTLNQLLPAHSITLFVLPAVASFSMRAGTVNPQGQFSLWLDGQAARTYILQSSTDLFHWSAISTNTLSSNSVGYLVPTTNSTHMFYRGLLSQP